MGNKRLLASAVMLALSVAACSDDSAHRKNDVVTEPDNSCESGNTVCTHGTVCVIGDTGSHCLCEGTGQPCSGEYLYCTADACVDVRTDAHHCGSVGHACESGEVCENGSCAMACSDGLENCNGSCRDTNSDVSNCGACGHSCQTTDALKHVASGFCQNQECNIVCEKNWVDEDGDMSNGCEKEVISECGNDVVELGESCDGKRLNDQTCESLVGVGSKGSIVCAADCMGFDISDCSKSTTCGNGRIDGSEKCDGRDLNDATCASIVGPGSTGHLGCLDNCGGYDVSECSAPTTCGNGSLDAGEICDGELLNSATCESIVGSGSTGTLKCTTNCADFDRSACTAAAVCGNDLVEAGEDCDSSHFNDKTCESIVGAGSKGSLICTGCKIDSSNCSAASTCGNNIVDGMDVCDGSDLNQKTCADIVGTGSTGTLGCKDNCSGYDISDCTAASTCGNGVIETGEICDGAKLNDETCESQVGHGSTGRLRCNATCTGFVTDGCTASTTCGNGILETGEICDGAKFANSDTSCTSEVGAGSKGNVLCASDCKSLNLSGCSAATQCGNNALDAGEVCEADNLNGATCASVVGAGSEGTLKCGEGCKHFDTSGCSKAESCGDGNINAGEVCDGSNLADRTCADVVGYGSRGVLKCKDNCSGYDTAACTPEVKCGNSKLDAGETCDGTLLNGATCSALKGFGSTGTVKCNADCSGYDITGCSEAIRCGNGALDDGELCDGLLFKDASAAVCANVVGFGSTGTIRCNATCNGYDASGCSNANPCGDGDIDAGELCDTTNLNGATCESIVGIGSTGPLLCDSTCKFNTTNCSPSRGCGNGSLEDSEECDQTAFHDNITSCVAYDENTYSKGKLKCADNCMIDTSGCTTYCGNGSVNTSKGEVCDGTNLNHKTCAKIVGEGSTGVLACAADCKTFDTSGCTEAKYCGDGKINVTGEECDTNTFQTGSNDCSDFSSIYESGKLSCTSGCKVNTDACKRKPYCGDGSVNNDELCDGTKFLNGRTNCATWDPDRYISGKVSCNNDCTLNYDACMEKPSVKCGNGVLDDEEFCDTNAFIVDSCSEWSPTFSGGTLKCFEDCNIDDSSCTLATPDPYCGDGNIDDGEECDTSAFPGGIKSCNGYDPYTYKTGTLSCTSACKIDTSACKAFCGNGEVNSSYNGYTIGEKCDTAKPVTRSCATELGTGYTGTLKCASNCKSFDTSECVAPFCGDGVVNQTSESCDDPAFRNSKTTCVAWNSTAYSGGNVSCNNDCSINYDACQLKETQVCGDGLINQASEACDQNVFRDNITTCAAYDSIYASGDLRCTNDCKIDPSNCVLAPVSYCGNHTLDDGEQCDGTAFNSNYDTCQKNDPTYTGGTVSCNTDCTVNLSACTKNTTCGTNQTYIPQYDVCAHNISSMSDLRSLSNNWNAHGPDYYVTQPGKKPAFILTKDINLNTDTWKGIGENYPFSGIFYGNNKTISGALNSSYYSNVEVIHLFSELSEDGVIDQLTLSVDEYDGRYNRKVAALVKQLSGGTIKNIYLDNCKIKAIDTTSNMGALVAFGHGTIQNIKADSLNIYFSGTASGTYGQFGGLIGMIDGPTHISDIDLNFDKNGTTSFLGGCDMYYYGGIVGYADSDVTMKNIRISGGKYGGSHYLSHFSVGGLIGWAQNGTVQIDQLDIGFDSFGFGFNGDDENYFGAIAGYCTSCHVTNAALHSNNILNIRTSTLNLHYGALFGTAAQSSIQNFSSHSTMDLSQTIPSSSFNEERRAIVCDQLGELQNSVVKNGVTNMSTSNGMTACTVDDIYTDDTANIDVLNNNRSHLGQGRFAPWYRDAQNKISVHLDAPESEYQVND